jgi:hypothetical protein
MLVQFVLGGITGPSTVYGDQKYGVRYNVRLVEGYVGCSVRARLKARAEIWSADLPLWKKIVGVTGSTHTCGL